jgi:hypothetical protein
MFSVKGTAGTAKGSFGRLSRYVQRAMALLASAMFGILGLSLGLGTLFLGLMGEGVLTAVLFAWTTLFLGIAALLVIRYDDRRVLLTALIVAALSAMAPVTSIAGLGDPEAMSQAWEVLVPLAVALGALLIALVLAPQTSRGSVATDAW